MAERDEQRILRGRIAGLADARDRLAVPDAGSAPMLVQVFAQTAIPTAAGKYFAGHPVTPGGVEGEGNVPTFAADPGTAYVLVVGSRVPVAGDYLIAEPVGGRWVAESGGGCRWSFLVRYCGGTAASLATVDAYQAGVLVASCTTNVAGACNFSVPPGVYDLVVTPTVGLGHDAYTATVTHVCGETKTVTLTQSHGFICQGDPLCCPAVPGMLTLTFTFGPGYVGSAWPNDTLNYDPTQGGWIGASTFSGGLRYRYPGCSGGVIGLQTQFFNALTGAWEIFGTVGLGGNDMNACDPYVQRGLIGSNPFPSSNWTVMG